MFWFFQMKWLWTYDWEFNNKSHLIIYLFFKVWKCLWLWWQQEYWIRYFNRGGYLLIRQNGISVEICAQALQLKTPILITYLPTLWSHVIVLLAMDLFATLQDCECFVVTLAVGSHYVVIFCSLLDSFCRRIYSLNVVGVIPDELWSLTYLISLYVIFSFKYLTITLEFIL